jgi:hypothetical protein
MPRDMFTDKALDNLRKIVNAKGELIGKAIGNVDLRIIERDEEVSFPWYPKTEDAEEVKYYLQFTESLCKMAIDKTRVTSKPKKSAHDSNVAMIESAAEVAIISEPDTEAGEFDVEYLVNKGYLSNIPEYPFDDDVEYELEVTTDDSGELGSTYTIKVTPPKGDYAAMKNKLY